MWDIVGFIESYGWINALGIIGIILFGLVVRHELTIRGREYQLALRRIELLEQSVKDADKVICRSECVALLKNIDENIRKIL